jgi:hypothetical protein
MATTSSSSSSNASSTLHLANCNAITMQQGVVEVTPDCHLLIRGKRILYVGSSAPPPPYQVTLLISFNTHPLPQLNSLLQHLHKKLQLFLAKLATIGSSGKRGFLPFFTNNCNPF